MSNRDGGYTSLFAAVESFSEELRQPEHQGRRPIALPLNRETGELLMADKKLQKYIYREMKIVYDIDAEKISFGVKVEMSENGAPEPRHYIWVEYFRPPKG